MLTRLSLRLFLALVLIAGLPGLAAAQVPEPVVVTAPASNSLVPFRDIQVTWQAPAVGSPAVDEYIIYVFPRFTTPVEFARVPGNQTSYVIPSLDRDRSYSLRINARNASGTDPSTASRFFTTKTTLQPVDVYCYVDGQTTVGADTFVSILVDLRNNPDGAVPAGYSFQFSWNPAVLQPANAPTESMVVRPGTFYNPRMNITPSFTQQTSTMTLFATALGNTVAEGHMIKINAKLLAPLGSVGGNDFNLIDNPDVTDNLLASTGGPIDHTFRVSNFIPLPVPPQLTEPADGASIPNRTPVLRWRESAFARNINVYIWPQGQPRPATPQITGTIQTVTLLNGIRSLGVPNGLLVDGVTYNWQVVPTNITGPGDSAIFTFSTPPLPTPTVSPSPTTPVPTTPPPTDTPTPTPTPVVTGTPMPTETPTPEPTNTPLPTTPSPTATTPSPSPTTPSPTATTPPTPSPSATTPPPTATPDPTIAPTGTFVPTPTATTPATPSPSPTPATPTPSPTASATPRPSASPTATVTPAFNQFRIHRWLVGDRVGAPPDTNRDNRVDGADLILP